MTTAIAERSNSTQFGREQVELIKRTIAKGASDDELKLFLAQCERTGLDPFDRQIYFIKRKQKDKSTGQWIEVGQTQTSIDGFRVVAERTGEMDGQEVAWCDETGLWTDIWLKKSPPFAARVLAYRKGCQKPFPGIARFDEYVQTFSDGKPTLMWSKMPANQIAKCAEALALRKAFPKQLSGLYTRDEMAQADQPDESKPAYVVEAPAPPEPREKPAADFADDICPDLCVDIPSGARLITKVEAGIAGAKARIVFNAPFADAGGKSEFLVFKDTLAVLAADLCQNAEPCFPELKKSQSGNWRVENLTRVPKDYNPPAGKAPVGPTTIDPESVPF